MHVDVRLSNVLSDAASAARRAESDGFAGGWIGETGHDPFPPMTVAAEHTASLRLGIAAVVAFARSPMSLAYVTDDLARYSDGRFTLGLCTQVATHVTDRFGMPYSRPVARMREYVAALRAIWACWRTGAPLDFRGEFYRHTLMTPPFAPGPTAVPPPPVYLAAVGTRMARLAGEIADGLLAHLFTSPSYLREVTLPALAKGLAAAGRERSRVEVVVPVFVVTGTSERAFQAAEARVRRQLAFYASTPAYAPVLARHGMSELHWELYERSLTGDWKEMAELIDDEVLHTFAVVGEPNSVARLVWARYRDLADRVVFSPEPGDDTPWPAIASRLRDLAMAPAVS